jgi:hypothetical protein
VVILKTDAGILYMFIKFYLYQINLGANEKQTGPGQNDYRHGIDAEQLQ